MYNQQPQMYTSSYSNCWERMETAKRLWSNLNIKSIKWKLQDCQNCFDGQEYLQQRLPIAMGSTLLAVSGNETRIFLKHVQFQRFKIVKGWFKWLSCTCLYSTLWDGSNFDYLGTHLCFIFLDLFNVGTILYLHVHLHF